MAQQAEDVSSRKSTSDETISSENHHAADLISKLPSREGWVEPLVFYKNYWLHPFVVEIMPHLQNSFKPRHDDIILASNPKCGTTWLKSLAFAVTKHFHNDSDNHPLLSRHPQDLVPYIELPQSNMALTDIESYIETLPSPRLLATHLPFSLLPKSITGTGCGCRVVNICRDPKDAFISRWHYDNKINRVSSVDLEAAFNMFCEGFSFNGPFWDHCLDYWRESIAMPDRVLFLKYEDMQSDPVKYVMKIAAFIGVPFSTKEEDNGVPEEIVRLRSFDKPSNLSVNKTGEQSRFGNMVIERSAFFRKGKVGDWQNHMSEEMGRKLDCIVTQKLKGSGLIL